MYESQDQVKRYVFRSRRNLSGPTPGSRRLSGSEFQTVGPATAKARAPMVLRRTRGTVSELTATRRSQMLAARDLGDRHAVVDEVRWSSVVKTTMYRCSRWVKVKVNVRVSFGGY